MVASRKRVLVVDDEAIVCESYKRVLAEAGYTVCTAGSGREALAACREQPFDVMLADLKMPDLDGLEVTRTVKKEFPQVQVLIITGYPTPQTAEEAQGLGVFDYLCKPVTPDRLSAITAAALAFPDRHMAPVVPSAYPAQDEAVCPVTPSTESEKVESEQIETEPTVTAALKTLGVLTVAPLIGLAYILLVPFIGFGMLLVAMGTALTKKLSWVKG